MKKFIYAIFAFAVLAFVGCTKEDIDDVTVQPGEAISFGVMTEGTRTVYGSQNTTDHTWPIYWTSTDQIRIFSAQAQSTQSTAAGVAYADYKVNGDGTASKATIAAVNADAALKWNKDYGVQHTFYATYPGANDNITVDAKGIATFPINRNQICDLESSTDGNYVYKPRMENQYMVATAGENPKDLADGEVWLDFKPVMTTLDIIVNGQATNNYSGNITVTGVSIIMEYNTTAANASTFAYDIEGGHIVASASSSATTNTVSNTIFIGVENGDVDAVELAPGKTLKLTAFVPPVQGVDYTMKVRVHATGTTELIATLATATAEGGATIKGTTTKLTPSSKAQFTLPVIPNPLPVGNNWITPLADDIYVSQLSIPGTHDACTGDGTQYGTGIGQTQDLDLADQWNMGIRCFDLRPRYGRTDGATVDGDTVHNLWINHGGVSTKWSMDAAVASFKEWLEANPGEFAIIIMRHEDEGDNKSSSWADTMADALADYAKMTNKTTGEGLTVNFKPDLTIGECRGKILFMMRSWTSYTGGPTVGGYHSWSHDAAAVECQIWGPGSSVGKLYVQDYYNLDLGFTFWPNYFATEGTAIYNKQNAICDMLDLAVNTHTNDDWKNVWFYNHTSGYIYYTVGDTGLATTDGYRGNAANNNPLVYNYLLGNTVTINGTSRTKPVGSTGIVIMDFVGARSSNGTTVYGDLCPQVIIDNNYKYTMKRKTN